MKLKSLEIEGFKSFSDKTLLLFDRSRTGIVGPNGCGKSNVVDAIRWVMGEQSAKHLRGKSMEDVIFAGASSRGASSVASVELVFSTEGSETPPQYASYGEISVGRKLYRTGESEYFVNKQPARLKDVRDLFLGTGIGANAYSIIEQGSIGALVTAKPEDRRRLVEEAAGISKFQVRKEAALRKMESTGQNLLRLKDILAELERQKNSLERQAKKAEKFKGVRDELKTLDLGLAAFDYDKLNRRQEGLVAEMKDLDARHTASEASLQEGETRFEELRLTQAELEREAADLQQQAYEWQNNLRIAEARLQARRDELARIDRESGSERARERDLLREAAETQAALDLADTAVVEAELEHAGSRESAEILESAHEATRLAADALFEELEEGRRRFHEAGKRLVEIEGKIASSSARLADLEGRVVADNAELETVSEKHRQMSRLFREAQEGLAGIRQLKFELGEQAEVIARQLADVETRVGSEQGELERIKGELLAKKSRLNSLEELERNFEGYQDGPKTLLERKRSGEIESVLGSVADFVETEPQYEGAASAVLGERAQFLVVSEAAESVACAGYLKTSSVGRGSFIAMDWAGSQAASERPWNETEAAAPGVVGRLADFVRVRSGYENLKTALFGDYVLVDRLERALDVWTGTRRPVVTFDGETISPDGVLSGGTLERTSKALLEKKREIKELHAEIADLVALVKAKEEACFDLNHKLKSLKGEMERMKTSCHEEDVKLAGREKDLTHCQKEIDSLDERRQRLSRQILQAGQEVEALRESLQDLREREAAEQSVCAETEAHLAAKKSEEEAFRARLADERERLTQEKIRLARAAERRAQGVRDAERLVATGIRLRHEIIACEERQSLLERYRLFNEDAARFGEKNIARILQHKTEADRVYADKRAAFDAVVARVLESEAALRDLRRATGALRDELNQKALELTELRNQLTRLQEQVYERYQIILPEVFTQHLGTVDDIVYADRKERADDLRGQMMRAGNVNLGAIDELKETSERFAFLDKQRVDLESSLASLEEAIQKINVTTKKRFVETFELINKKFAQLFPKLFEGGEAYLKLSDPENILETGVEIIAQPPGKKLQSISLLSGGEKALTAVSLLFAIFLIKPSPFCLLDEVDAPLDDANVDRYNEIVREMSQRTQFIVITHNKRTMQVMDALYGVTMEKSGISQIVSVNLDG